MTGAFEVWVVAIYLGASVAAFMAYRGDKAAALRGERRTPEATLHFLSLIGGWPGALLAQRVLRHKTGKLSFQVLFWGTVLVNCSAAVWLWQVSE